MVNATSRSLYPEKEPVSIVQEAGWAPGPVCTSAETLAHTGIRSPDHPVRSESLYRLSYPGPPELQFFLVRNGYLTAKVQTENLGKGKGKAIPLQAWTGLEGSRSLMFPDFKTVGT